MMVRSRTGPRLVNGAYTHHVKHLRKNHNSDRNAACRNGQTRGAFGCSCRHELRDGYRSYRADGDVDRLLPKLDSHSFSEVENVVPDGMSLTDVKAVQAHGLPVRAALRRAPRTDYASDDREALLMGYARLQLRLRSDVVEVGLVERENI